MNNHNSLIYHLEELATNAWPARITQTVGGWRLRYTDGITRRANSVWPNLHPPASQPNQTALNEQLATVEEFYNQRNLPARFQICPAAQPSTLDNLLAQRGYQTDAPTNVQTISIAAILSQINLESLKPEKHKQEGLKQEKSREDLGTTVTINQHLNDDWFESYCQAETLSPEAITVRRGILERIAPATGFAQLAGAHDLTAALGLGVVERGWLGIFCMTTKSAFRRRGFASSILHALAKWGRERGAINAYLQVMTSNHSAQKLYTRVGFNTVYQYHYREKLGE